MAQRMFGPGEQSKNSHIPSHLSLGRRVRIQRILWKGKLATELDCIVNRSVFVLLETWGQSLNWYIPSLPSPWADWSPSLCEMRGIYSDLPTLPLNLIFTFDLSERVSTRTRLCLLSSSPLWFSVFPIWSMRKEIKFSWTHICICSHTHEKSIPYPFPLCSLTLPLQCSLCCP